MRNAVVYGALIGSAAASPSGEWKPHWGWPHHKPPGWNEPSVYTPPPPKATWSHRLWSASQSKYPGPTPPPYSAAIAASSSTASPYPTPIARAEIPIAACASVSELVSSFTVASPAATPTVPAELAYECITSVPFNSSAAIALLDSLRPYINWQTTIEYLKDPPADYAAHVQAPYDFYAGFERIYTATEAGSYANEHDFCFAPSELFQRAHDGHFSYSPDSVTKIFAWGRQTPLVSVSPDGIAIPEVYVYADVLASSFNATFTPSPITLINGQNSTEWLLNFSQYGSLQDPDALWNNMFYGLAQVALGSSGTGTGTFSGGGRGNKVYPGPDTTLTFANGSSLTTVNFARVLVPFDNIATGEDIYRSYFTPPPGEPRVVGEFVSVISSVVDSGTADSATATAADSATATATVPAPGYPSPFIREVNNLNSGYFLDGEGYDDVAVLAVNSFVGSIDDEIPFQQVNTYFIDQAVAQGKKKLIVDVSANGGGTILQGYDLFKQLFPQILPYGATRFRAHEAFDLIGQEISAYSATVPRSIDSSGTLNGLISSVFNYETDTTIDYEPFTSWAEKYGPHAFGPQPDNFTSIIRWNMSDVLTPDNSGGIVISGYGSRSNITTQPFEAENIIIVYDGYCASTCTIFSELMRQQAGVKTIALGGRPTRDIIQAVGGVKGTNDYTYDYIHSSVAVPFQQRILHGADYYSNTTLGEYSNLPFFRATVHVVNARDGIRQGDESQLPLQFHYEPADCRIYYTPAMVVDETAVWKTVADTAFNGVSHCVAGNLTSNAGSSKRGGLRRKHGVRRDLNTSEHFEAITSVWTGKGGVTVGGDGIMYP